MAYNKNLSEIDSLIEYTKIERMQLIFKNSWKIIFDTCQLD